MKNPLINHFFNSKQQTINTNEQSLDMNTTVTQRNRLNLSSLKANNIGFTDQSLIERTMNFPTTNYLKH